MLMRWLIVLTAGVVVLAACGGAEAVVQVTPTPTPEWTADDSKARLRDYLISLSSELKERYIQKSLFEELVNWQVRYEGQGWWVIESGGPGMAMVEVTATPPPTFTAVPTATVIAKIGPLTTNCRTYLTPFVMPSLILKLSPVPTVSRRITYSRIDRALSWAAECKREVEEKYAIAVKTVLADSTPSPTYTPMPTATPETLKVWESTEGVWRVSERTRFVIAHNQAAIEFADCIAGARYDCVLGWKYR